MELNEELVKKAKELEVKYDSEKATDDTLTTLIADKEEENKKKEEGKDPDYWKSEAEKAIKKRDEAKKDKRKLKEQLDTLESALSDAKKGAADPEEIQTLRDELKDLKVFKQEMDDKAEEEDLKTKTEKERLEVGFNKELKSLKDQLDEIQTESKRALDKRKDELEKLKQTNVVLQRNSLKSEIIEAAVGKEALKPSQIVRLTISDFEWDDHEQKFIHFKKDKKGKIIDELSVSEFIDEYLSDEDNENLVRGSVKKGFSSDKKATDKSGSKDTDLTITDQIKKEAEDRGFEPDVWVKIKQKQNKKLNREEK